MTGGRDPRTPDYLKHILQAIAQIESYMASTDQQMFLGNRLLQDAVIRNLEIIGEAANTILKWDNEFGNRHPDIPLKAAYAMRNALAHGYFVVDPLLVWGTVRSDLPKLKIQVFDALTTYTRP